MPERLQVNFRLYGAEAERVLVEAAKAGESVGAYCKRRVLAEDKVLAAGPGPARPVQARPNVSPRTHLPRCACAICKPPKKGSKG